MNTKKILSIETITKLIKEENYFRFKRQCENPEDKSIQEEFNLTHSQVLEIFEDPRLKKVRKPRAKNAGYSKIVFKEDIKSEEIQTSIEKTPSTTFTEEDSFEDSFEDEEDDDFLSADLGIEEEEEEDEILNTNFKLSSDDFSSSF